MCTLVRRSVLPVILVGSFAWLGAQPSPLERINLPEGFSIDVYAEGLANPRSMVLSPNGTLFVGSPTWDGTTVSGCTLVMVGRPVCGVDGYTFTGGRTRPEFVSRSCRGFVTMPSSDYRNESSCGTTKLVCRCLVSSSLNSRSGGGAVVPPAASD